MSEFGQRINEIEKNLQYVYCKVKNMGSSAVQSVSSASTFLSVNNADPKNPTLNMSDGGFWKASGNPNVTYSPDGRILSYIGGLNETTLGVVDYTKLTERLKDNERLKPIDDALVAIQTKFQQLYDDYNSGKITQAEFEQKQNELNNEYSELNKQRTTVFNEEAGKLKDVEGIQVLKVDSNQATFFKSVYTTNSVQSAYYSDKISIWETRLGFYENGSYRYGYDGSEFIQHLKDINTTVRISSYQTMGNAPYSKDVVARYPTGTIAFLSSALDSSLKKFVSAPYSSGTAYFATDKIPIFTNVQNAQGDSTFNRQLVVNANGVVGSIAAETSSDVSLICSSSSVVKQDATNIDIGFSYKFKIKGYELPAVTASIVMFHTETSGSSLTYSLGVNVTEVFKKQLVNNQMDVTCKLKLPIAELKSFMSGQSVTNCNISISLVIGSNEYPHLFTLVLP